MSEQQYLVIADRTSMADESWIAEGDRVTYGAVNSTGELVILRIERPVPTTASSELLAAGELQDPHLPTRDQITEAIAGEVRTGNQAIQEVQATRFVQGITDAVLALLQKGAER